MRQLLLQIAAEVVALIVDLAADHGEEISPEDILASARAAIAANRARRAAAREANTKALEDGV